MHRKPVVAGQFYPASGDALRRQVAAYMEAAGEKQSERTLLAMAPHAGYIYSGAVAGATIGRANLSDTVLLLGPNHTGRGPALSIWPDGAWPTPGVETPVDNALVQALIAAAPEIAEDTSAHLAEHSLEVMLPFLAAAAPGLRVAPMVVAEHRLDRLLRTAERIAAVLSGWAEPVSIVVSSDMSHYVSADRARKQDRAALDKIEALDPEGLFETVRRLGVTMCGVLPMTLGLAVSKALGADRAEIVQYATSGDVSGDYSQVVGYAGALVWKAGH